MMNAKACIPDSERSEDNTNGNKSVRGGDNSGKLALYDMHCHLDFAENAKDVAKESASAGITALNSTVVPSSFVSACNKFAAFPHIYVALGLHPWWVADNQIAEVDLERFEALAGTTRFIGEIGLDFYGARKESKAKQEDVFFRALCACNAANAADAAETAHIDAAGAQADSRTTGKVIFIHAVRATTRTLDMLDKCGTFDGNTVVFHWFQGNEDEFGRALSSGAFFTVNMRMLASDRTRLFAKAIPENRLLLETDNPPHAGMVFSTDIWRQELENTLIDLAELRGTTPQDLAELLAANSEACLA